MVSQRGIGTELYTATVRLFDGALRKVGSTDWERATPCTDWTVRDLVNHVVTEDVWAAPLLEGRTVEEVSGEIAEDSLGADPSGAWQKASETAIAAVGDDTGRTVHLTGRDVSAEDYLMELATDHLIHTWDLLAALGGEETLPVPLVGQVATWFSDREAAYREYGVIGPRTPIRDDASTQGQLLAAFGRASQRDPVDLAVDRFNEAFGRGDVDAIMAAMTDDCIFEDTAPPHGTRHVGQSSVRAAWVGFFRGTVNPQFSTKRRFRCDDRVVIEWLFTWGGAEPGEVSGVDLLTVRDNKVAAKIAYVKG